MQYIAFDFETSGLPKGRRNVKITPDTLHCFDTCRAVSLSAARFSNKGRLIDTFDAIIHPTDFQISQGSIDIHGITQERAEREGRPFIEVFLDFARFIGPRTTTMVAHNAIFDTSVLRSEMIRHKLDLSLIQNLNFRCTLELHKEKHLTPIRLGVLYKEIFGVDFENAHNSLADCIACGKVYPYLLGHERALKPLGIPKVVISASSVSSAIGIGFTKAPDLVSELWKKYKPQTFDGVLKDEEAVDTLNSKETTKKILAAAMSFKSESSADVAEKTRALYHQLEYSGLTPKSSLTPRITSARLSIPTTGPGTRIRRLTWTTLF